MYFRSALWLPQEKKKNYEEERTAPKGMEWKNWEGDKLKMKDDDDDE